MKIFRVGIDGGATKTLLRLTDEQGNILAETRSGPANIASAPDVALDSIHLALKEALEQTGLSNRDDISLSGGAGLAGAETPGARDYFLQHVKGFSHLTVTSDAFTSCLGAHEGQDGAIIALGTGSVGYAICGDRTRRVGGYGFPHGDEGGGAWVGLKALQKMFQAEDGRHPPSRLTSTIRQHILETSSAGLTAWAIGLTATKAATLAPFVTQAASMNCSDGEEILQQAVTEAERIARALTQENGFTTLPFALLGSLADIIFNRSDYFQRHATPAKGDALAGALFLSQTRFSHRSGGFEGN